jgi:hypothetical protein
MLVYLILLIVSMLFLIQSAWILGTFLRLKLATKMYNNNAVVESAMQMSLEYINTGYILAIIYILFSLGLLIFSGIKLAKTLKK